MLNRTHALLIAMALFLAACGGGGGGGGSSPTVTGPTPVVISDAEAARLVTQATFGVTDADIEQVKSKGYSSWVSDQLALAPSASHQAFVERRLTEMQVTNARATITATEFYQSFWSQRSLCFAFFLAVSLVQLQCIEGDFIV
jgi:hypothetical protein